MSRVGWFVVLLLSAVLVGGALAFVLLWAWPLLVDVATVLGFLAAVFAGGVS